LNFKGSSNFYSDKWLYLIAGIHGEEIEGMFILKQIIDWMKASLELSIPSIIIPSVDIDGYMFSNMGIKKENDLNQYVKYNHHFYNSLADRVYWELVK